MKNIFSFSITNESASTKPRWFDGVSLAERKRYAREVCASIRSRDGQNVVAISYPRVNSDFGGQLVAVYDLDAGRIRVLPLGEFLQLEVIRSAEEADFEASDIRGSKYTCDAEDISLILF